MSHFIERTRESGDLPKGKFGDAEFRSLLLEKIGTVNMDRVKEGIIRFIPNGTRLDIWTPVYFKDLTGHLVTE